MEKQYKAITEGKANGLPFYHIV